MVSQDIETNNNNNNNCSTNLHHFLNSTQQPHFENPYLNPNPTEYYDPSDHQMGHNNTTRHFMDLLENSNSTNRLSLSLGSDILQANNETMQQHYNYNRQSDDQFLQQQQQQVEVGFGMENYCFVAGTGFSSGNSVYLKAAQSVLEEVVELGSKNIDVTDIKRVFMSSRGVCNDLRTEMLSNGLLLSTDKHELQILLSKLISLLEQVEGRYDEYCHRMEGLISSFEMVAGDGAAKCYTALALQAMCRHFCSLRDAILTQIRTVRKKISPELPKLGGVLSNRLSLQQIGLIQAAHGKQAWRPIRGLPETSVAILRAWLFDHFLHPYPNDAEKLTLASQTGLSKNQVSNWFINARVRFWKPMIEEMYREEFGDSSVESSGDSVADQTEE